MIYVATVQVCGTGPDQWWVAFSGQTVVAASQIFILGIPAQLAATWFPADQVSSACAIGVFGNQVRPREFQEGRDKFFFKLFICLFWTNHPIVRKPPLPLLSPAHIMLPYPLIS